MPDMKKAIDVNMECSTVVAKARVSPRGTAIPIVYGWQLSSFERDTIKAYSTIIWVQGSQFFLCSGATGTGQSRCLRRALTHTIGHVC